MSDGEHWSDPRWGDPATRAEADAPATWAAPTYADPAAAAPLAARTRRPLSPAVAALAGVAVGAALAVPFGLAHRDTRDDVSFAAPTVPGTQSAPLGSITAVTDTVDKSVVDITSRLTYQHAVAAGTGMVLTATGDILTNNHVIADATSITVTSVTTHRSYPATVVGTDPTEDVAVLHVSGATDLVPIKPGNSSTVKIGQQVVAIGNAGGVGGAPAVAAGIVTALGQQITATDTNGSNAQHLTGLIETDAAIQPGDSGGPLADMQARVIGMDTAATLGHLIGGGQTSDHGFAIPIQHALAIAHQIQAGHGSSTIHIGTRGMIGVQVADISAGSGADVQQVTAGSPADRAGIRPGDTIVAIDGHAVTTSASLSTLIRKHRPGEKVSVDWTSADGSRHHALITLVPGPPD